MKHCLGFLLTANPLKSDDRMASIPCWSRDTCGLFLNPIHLSTTFLFPTSLYPTCPYYSELDEP